MILSCNVIRDVFFSIIVWSWCLWIWDSFERDRGCKEWSILSYCWAIYWCVAAGSGRIIRVWWREILTYIRKDVKPWYSVRYISVAGRFLGIFYFHKFSGIFEWGMLVIYKTLLLFCKFLDCLLLMIVILLFIGARVN